MATIIIDSREQLPYVFRGQQTITSGLSVGDYTTLEHPEIVIERKKTIEEVHTNFTKKRKQFFAELDRAEELGIYLVIVCEFPLTDLHKKSRFARINARQIANTFNSIYLNYGIPVIFAGNRTQGQWWTKQLLGYLK